MPKMGRALKAPSGKTVPPTKTNRQLDPKVHSHLRSNRTATILNVRKKKVVRDKKTGEIIKGSVLDPSDKIEKGKMARIAPDRRWFGNSRVIGQSALEEFKSEMSKKLADPYQIITKTAKLPLSLLEEPEEKAGLKKQLDFKAAFGKKSTRKRAQISADDFGELHGNADTKEGAYVQFKDRQLVENVEREADPLTRTGGAGGTGTGNATRWAGRDPTVDRHPMEKGQSGRIWNQLWKVIDSSDVLLQVLDVRDPLGTRSEFLEKYLQKERKYKHLVFVLNKIDLVPTWVTARWLQILSKERPTIAFHASMTNPFGKGNLINLLRQFSRLRGAGKGKGGATLSCGLFGYPNVGKSSVINTLRAKKVCPAAPIPGSTRVWQYVNLSKKIFLIDCPGVVHDRDHKNNDVQAVLKGIVRVEKLSIEKEEVIATVLEIVKTADMAATYGLKEWANAGDFLLQIAEKRGKLLKGGVPDADCAARMVLHDWIEGRLPWFNAPPFDSNQQYRDSVALKDNDLLKRIQNYSTFNIVNQELRNAAEEDSAPLARAERNATEKEEDPAALVDALNSDLAKAGTKEEKTAESPGGERAPMGGGKRKERQEAAPAWAALRAAARAGDGGEEPEGTSGKKKRILSLIHI